MRNKIVASVSLAAFLLTTACGPASTETAEPAASAPAPVAESTTAPVAEPETAAPAEISAEAPAAGDVEPVAAPVETAEGPASPYAAANLEAGKQSYMIKCRACHAVDAAAGDMVGPNLDGVFQRKPGGKPGFRYSEAMVAFAASTDMQTWQPEEVDEWLAKPTEYLPGSAMFFNGIKDAGERRNLIGYLIAETAQ